MEAAVPVHAHVRKDGSATVVCPACGRSKTVTASNFAANHRIKAKCPCHAVFSVIFDFRRQYRKNVLLRGRYKILAAGGSTALPPHSGTGEMLVTDISRGGLRLEMPPDHGIMPGQQLELSFQLDDKRRSEICRTAVVRHVCGRMLGCEFSAHEHYDKVLGFYLNP